MADTPVHGRDRRRGVLHWTNDLADEPRGSHAAAESFASLYCDFGG